MSEKKKFNFKSATFRIIVLVCLVISGIGSYVWYQLSHVEVTLTGQRIYTYDTQAQIKDVLNNYSSMDGNLPVYNKIPTIDKIMCLNFEGETDAVLLQRITDILEEYHIQATFFLSADVISNAQIERLLQNGDDFQNYTLTGTAHMENLEDENFVTEICRAQAVYQQVLKYSPTIVKLPTTEVSPKMIQMIQASGFDSLVTGDKYVNFQSFKNEKQVKEYVNSLDYGDIVNVKLSGYLDALEYKNAEVDEKPAEDFDDQVDKVVVKDELSGLSSDEKLVKIVEWLCKSLKESKFRPILIKDSDNHSLGDLQTMAKENEPTDGTLESISYVHTTDREMGIIFRGITNEDAVTSILKKLKKLDMKATFVVTGRDIEGHEDVIKQIIKAGHQIINGGFSKKSMADADYYENYVEIYRGIKALEGIGLKSNYYLPWGYCDTPELQAATKASGMKLISYGYNVLHAYDAEKTKTEAEVVKNGFNNGRLVLCRGDIVYMDLTKDIGDLKYNKILEELYEQKILPTKYDDDMLHVTTLNRLLDHTWNYPIVNEEANNRISIDHTTPDASHYISTKMPDSLVKKSQGENSRRVAFLTFDDFGDEKSISNLLTVLRKHNVKGTFFIITQNVTDSTMNLVRAIAEDGHDIGSHSDTHFISDVTSNERAKELSDDLIRSNEKLASIVGDKDVLKTYYRPPTLALTNLGRDTILSLGYSYIVAGDVSTADYQAPSVDWVVDVLKNGSHQNDGSRIVPQNGTIYAMHMTRNAQYTAEALDQYLTWQESLPDGDPQKFSFELLSDYLK